MLINCQKLQYIKRNTSFKFCLVSRNLENSRNLCIFIVETSKDKYPKFNINETEIKNYIKNNYFYYAIFRVHINVNKKKNLKFN